MVIIYFGVKGTAEERRERLRKKNATLLNPQRLTRKKNLMP